MFKPAESYRSCGGQAEGRWHLAWRRPLGVAFVLGCTMSLITASGLTPRIAGPATVYWSFVPLAEMGALAAVCRRPRRALSFSRMSDLFFAGHGPWLVWLIGLCSIWSFCVPVQAFASSKAIWLYGAVAVALVWSGYIDFCFFRYVLGHSPRRAAWDLVLQRLISWTAIIAIFGAPAIPPEIVAKLGL